MRNEIDGAAWERDVHERAHPRVGEPSAAETEHVRPALAPGGVPFDPTFEGRRARQLAEWRDARPRGAVRKAVEAFATAAAGDGNLMPAMIDAFRADLTIGEVTDVLIDRFGSVNPSRRTYLDATAVGA
jgi:methylmalonyl-CoA mutase N-terminal domain/subunit